MTAPPVRLKIVSKRFTVEYLETGKGDLDPDHAGECRTAEQRILIETGMKPDSQKDTLLHEVLHAISDEMELDMTEAQVAGMSRGVLCVLLDNPTFARYLLRKS